MKRSLAVFGAVFLVFVPVGIFRGQPLAKIVGEAALWAGIVSAIYIASRLYRSLRGFDGELWGEPPAESPEDRYRTQ